MLWSNGLAIIVNEQKSVNGIVMNKCSIIWSLNDCKLMNSQNRHLKQYGDI